MRLGEIEDFRRRAGLDELRQHLAAVVVRVLDLAVQLAVGERAGAAFAELHIRFRVQLAPAPQAPGVIGALANHLAALQKDRAKAHLRQDQSREQAAGAGSDHDRPWDLRGRRLRHEAVAQVGRNREIAVALASRQDRGFVPDVDIERVDQHDRRPFARVDGAAENGIAAQVLRCDPQPLQHGGCEIRVRMVEGKPEVGQSQHDLAVCVCIIRDRRGAAEKPRGRCKVTGIARAAPLLYRRRRGNQRRMTTAAAAFDVIIIGAGAAGLMCALTAGQRGKKVLLLDHASEVGEKIRISGGGRCNFTNLQIGADRFLSGNPNFCKSALDRYTQADFIALVERHRIAYHEKTLGQLFCNDTSRSIIAMLLAECARGNVDVRTDHAVTDVSHADGFRVTTAHGTFTAASLVLATGGLSIPKMGATGFAYDLAQRFGLRVTERLPALVPLKATPQMLGIDEVLAGVALEAVVSCAGQSFREAMLFTHRGLSGPAILQISSYWRAGDVVSLDVMPDCDARATLLERKRARPRAEAKTVLAEMLPARLAHALAEKYLPHGPIAALSDRVLARLCRPPQALGGSRNGIGGLVEGRGDPWRDRHPRPVVENDGGAEGAGPLCHRRSG